MRTDKDGASARRPDPADQFFLPAAAGGEMPLVEPGLQAVALELGGQALDQRLILAVMGEKDVVTRAVRLRRSSQRLLLSRAIERVGCRSCGP
jgi:hypothetical protein